MTTDSPSNNTGGFDDAELLDSVTMLELGGRVWPLRLDLATMARFEKATGVNMLINAKVLFPRNLSMTACQALIWAGISQHVDDDDPIRNPRTGPEIVGRWIMPKDLEKVADAIHEMLQKGLPDEKPADPAESAEKKMGTNGLNH